MKKRPPTRCVVDTNVAVTANGAQTGAARECVDASARALQRIMYDGHLFLDDGGLIVEEYRRNLRATGQPGPGDAFLRWVLQHEWGQQRVTRVVLTAKPDLTDDFEELPPPRQGVVYDPSDRKFLAVAASHAEHPPILQATDSKWWGWRESLADANVTIHFLCPEIEHKYLEKMGE